MAGDVKRVSDEFPELFHYTTVAAFENIYKSQTFWATYYQDLNDRSELLRFRMKVGQHITPHVRKIFAKRVQCDEEFARVVKNHGGLDAVVSREVAIQLDVIHRNTFGEDAFRETFVCSFCAHRAGSYEGTHGLLSQWRGYGGGGGVAIVLDTAGIEERMKREADVFAHPINQIGDVKYDNDNVGIQRAFCRVFGCLPGILDALYSGQQAPYEEIFDHFVQGSTLVKHHAFHEENEIRIVVAPRPTKPGSIFYDVAHDTKPQKVVRYRRRGESEVRYISLFGEAPLPIERVVVGPSWSQNVNYQAIKDIAGGLEIEVIKSDTPFLG